MPEQDSQESHVDQSILDRMTPEGRDLVRRVLASSDLEITVTEGRRALFPPREVPSFVEVVGVQAAGEYRKTREDLDAQEIRNRRRARATRKLGRNGLI